MAKGVDGIGARTALGYLAARRDRIAAALASLAERRGSELERAPGGGREALGRVVEYCLRGKMIRGSLVYLGLEAAGAGSYPEAEGAADSTAVAMELFQAGLLVHDDIMDRDETRRGAPSIHARYAREAKSAGSPDGLHVGEALGICVGDLCYFEAFAELSHALAGRPLAASIAALCSERLAEVAAAQMADVRWGSSEADVSEKEILSLYLCKTARYSFSLPLAAGALLAGDEDAAAELSELGEALGIAFQIRDDELGLFGDPAVTGKGSGGDVREGKKTLLRSRLLAVAPTADRAKLGSIFGNARATDADIEYARGLAESLGVRASLASMSGDLASRARSCIAGLRGLDAGTRAVLDGLVDYVVLRDK